MTIIFYQLYLSPRFFFVVVAVVVVVVFVGVAVFVVVFFSFSFSQKHWCRVFICDTGYDNDITEEVQFY